MRKPNNYDNTKVGGNFEPITPGGHHLVIKHIKEEQSKSGKDMILVSFDMGPNDSQAGRFRKQFEEDTRPDKKWPIKGRQYIVLEDQDGNCSSSYKSFVTAVEDSNNWRVNWDADYKQFVGKRVGGVFGEVEFLKNDNSVGTTVELRWFRNDNNVMEAEIPKTKLLKNRPTAPVTPDGFINIPDGADDEEMLPFD